MPRTMLNRTTRVGAVNPVAGSAYDAQSYTDTTSLEVGGAGARIETVTVDSGVATTYTLSIGEDTGSLVVVTYVSAVTNTTTIAAGIAAAINVKIGVSNLVFATSNVAVVTITGRQKGTAAAFVVSETDSNLSVGGAPTSPTDATAIPFGVMAEQSTATKAAGTTFVGSAVGTGTYTAQITTSQDIDTDKAIAASDTLTLIVSGDFDGLGRKDYTGSAIYASSAAQTVTNATNAINAALPANTVSVANASGVLTFTAEVAGVGFDVSGGCTENGTSSAITFTTGTPNATPTGAGISIESHAIEQASDGATKYTAGTTLAALTAGKIYGLLDASLTVALGDPVFVRVTAGAGEQVGALRNVADGTDCLPISAFGFKAGWLATNTTDMNGNSVAPLWIQRV